MEDAFRGGDAAGPARRLGIDGDRERTLEQDVALDAHAERQAQGRHFRQAERSQFGLAEIGVTEQGVAVLVEFGRQPGADAERIEEADDGYMIAVAGPAVGESALALLRGDKIGRSTV